MIKAHTVVLSTIVGALLSGLFFVLNSNGALALTDDNRADCNQIRGTDYLSDEERAWFLAYCTGALVYSQPAVSALPEIVYLLPPPSRASEPFVSVTCYSSLGSATAAGDLQNVPLSAVAGEVIYCNASISGGYSSIDWAGGSVNGAGASFATRFPPGRVPRSIRVQVNWGGNPVIKYISVTTVSCVLPPGYPFCLP